MSTISTEILKKYLDEQISYYEECERVASAKRDYESSRMDHAAAFALDGVKRHLASMELQTIIDKFNIPTVATTEKETA